MQDKQPWRPRRGDAGTDLMAAAGLADDDVGAGFFGEGDCAVLGAAVSDHDLLYEAIDRRGNQGDETSAQRRLGV